MVDSIYTDFSKAFDKLDHNILVGKLSILGINGSLLTWIESYLSSRVQYVKIKDLLSVPIEVLSGVPQGAHLAPLLFNLYINDISQCFLNSNCFIC